VGGSVLAVPIRPSSRCAIRVVRVRTAVVTGAVDAGNGRALPEMASGRTAVCAGAARVLLARSTGLRPAKGAAGRRHCVEHEAAAGARAASRSLAKRCAAFTRRTACWVGMGAADLNRETGRAGGSRDATDAIGLAGVWDAGAVVAAAVGEACRIADTSPVLAGLARRAAD
jgi:hypothetical protein